MMHYETLNETIAKYIIKFFLKAHNEVKNRIKEEAIILPENIIFNERSKNHEKNKLSLSFLSPIVP